jgi:Biopolymer transport protein ExbD/TolR.
MRNSDESPKVNAGSMADIAFLLLIFFLVTTTIPNDKGIARKLPESCPPGQKCDVVINERNVLRLSLNEFGELMVNERISLMEDLRELAKDFIDNNGDASCTFCSGKGIKTSSDNPREAAISITTHRNTPYKDFIRVQDELTAAYLELRTAYAKTIFKKDAAELSRTEMEAIKKAYPFQISEAAIE